MSYRARLRVRFADVDHGRVMYFPKILHYFHQALEDFFADDLGFPMPGLMDRDRVGLPIVHAEVDYRRPFRFGDEMDVELRVVRVSANSVRYEFTGRHAGDERPDCRAWIQAACIDMDRFAARVFPEDLRAALEARLEPTQPRLAKRG